MRGLGRVVVQNIDSRDIAFLWQGAASPPAGTVAHRLMPGDSMRWLISDGDILWGWSERACNVVVSDAN